MQLYIALRKFVADSHSCTASHFFLGHRPTNLFLSVLVHVSMTRWVSPRGKTASRRLI